MKTTDTTTAPTPVTVDYFLTHEALAEGPSAAIEAISLTAGEIRVLVVDAMHGTGAMLEAARVLAENIACCDFEGREASHRAEAILALIEKAALRLEAGAAVLEKGGAA